MLRFIFITILLSLSLTSKEYVVYVDFNNVLKEIEINKEKERREKIIHAIIFKESEGLDTIVGDMVGQLQIRPIMVREVNRILGSVKYSLEDRMDKVKSIEMFNIYTNHHTPDWNLELVARRWNGGFRGEHKTATINYYKQVKQILELL
jgi:hypothetical protein